MKVISSWNKGVEMPIKTRDKIRNANLGNRHSLECISKMKVSAKRAEANNKWLGDKVGYRALHYWIARQLGKPTICSKCGVIGCGRQIHWANKSHSYLRDVNDWIRLCAKCHKDYDRAFSGNCKVKELTPSL